MTAPWWRSLAEEQRLSQGDVLLDSTFALQVHPRTPLARHVFGKGSHGWKEGIWQPDNNGYGHSLGRGRIAHALVVTHSCQLDKDERTSRVLLAPVSSISGANAQDRDRIMGGFRIAFVPLPAVPELGDCYADLRALTPYDRRTVDQLTRVATMSQIGVVDLRERISIFFMRPAEGSTGEIVQMTATFKGPCESEHDNEMALTKGATFPSCQSPGCGKSVHWKVPD